MIASKKIIFFTLFVFVLIFISNCEDKPSNDQKISNLIKTSEFPTDEEVVLGNPVNFIFSEDFIYISDQKNSNVLVFNLEGELAGKIGNEGRGPAEFNRQHFIFLDQGKLYINDQGNQRLSVYDIKKKEFQIHPDLRRLFSFVVNDDKIYSYTLIPPIDTDDIEDLPLLKVTSTNGEMKRSFGNHLHFLDNMVPHASMNKLALYNQKLYALFLSYPIVNLYDLGGDLEKSLDLSFQYEEIAENNYQQEIFANRGQGLKTIFTAFRVNENGIFINIRDEDLIIDQFDHEGNFLNRYKEAKRDSDFYVKDIEVIQSDNGELKFYILNVEDGIPKVTVYQAS